MPNDCARIRCINAVYGSFTPDALRCSSAALNGSFQALPHRNASGVNVINLAFSLTPSTTFERPRWHFIVVDGVRTRGDGSPKSLALLDFSGILTDAVNRGRPPSTNIRTSSTASVRTLLNTEQDWTLCVEWFCC